MQTKVRFAADLPSVGGLDVLADVLLEEGGVRIQALRVLQTAASNNVKFQLKLLEQEAAAVPWLLQVCSLNLDTVAAVRQSVAQPAVQQNMCNASECVAMCARSPRHGALSRPMREHCYVKMRTEACSTCTSASPHPPQTGPD